MQPRIAHWDERTRRSYPLHYRSSRRSPPWCAAVKPVNVVVDWTTESGRPLVFSYARQAYEPTNPRPNVLRALKNAIVTIVAAYPGTDISPIKRNIKTI